MKHLLTSMIIAVLAVAGIFLAAYFLYLLDSVFGVWSLVIVIFIIAWGCIFAILRQE